MSSPIKVEHFCTLFDSGFLPIGLALYESLLKNTSPFQLWILCIDDKVYDNLIRLNLPHIKLIALHDIEDARLKKVKSDRTLVEYCWTLTPILPSFILKNNPEIERVTYLDADLYFFNSPAIIFQELEKTQKSVLITEHAYAPEYDQTESSGRFCVQFVCFYNNKAAKNVLHWWSEKCIDWCYARHEEGKFGDQKYLDAWPTLFKEQVHILENKNLAIAPWNIAAKLQENASEFLPIFYHFHGLRLLPGKCVRINRGYKLGGEGSKIYKPYLATLKRTREFLLSKKIPWPIHEKINSLRSLFRVLKDLLRLNVTKI